MPIDRPLIVLVKAPVPDPSVVWLSLIIGVPEVFQHTPRALTLAPPSDKIDPPLLAVVCVIAETAVVVSIGNAALVVEKLITEPYAVPALLVAYPRT